MRWRNPNPLLLRRAAARRASRPSASRPRSVFARQATKANRVLGCATRARFLVEESNFPLQSDVLQKTPSALGGDIFLVPETGRARLRWNTDPANSIYPSRRTADPHTSKLIVEIDGTNYLGGASSCVGIPTRGTRSSSSIPRTLWQDARRQGSGRLSRWGSVSASRRLCLADAQAQRLSRRVRELERRTRGDRGG